jgi:pSer/pThr/pTyr-binding forkhead associated (FHA) protein
VATPARLVWKREDGSCVDFSLTSDIMVVGRDEAADIRVDEALVSRNHARMERRSEGFVVVDLGSTNLTRVNGRPINEHLLKSGDEVRFARARCIFLDGESDPPGDTTVTTV